MKTLAPELSALMTILRSGGPVISTRRSRRSCGIARDAPVRGAQRAGFLREVRQLAGVELALFGRAPREQSGALRGETVRKVVHERDGVRRQHRQPFLPAGGVDTHVCGRWRPINIASSSACS